LRGNETQDRKLARARELNGSRTVLSDHFKISEQIYEQSSKAGLGCARNPLGGPCTTKAILRDTRAGEISDGDDGDSFGSEAPVDADGLRVEYRGIFGEGTGGAICESKNATLLPIRFPINVVGKP
jgi:hypothetical protein